jgi:hypothetical protein
MANWPEATKAYFTRMPRMTLRIRHHTLKLRSLCWVKRRLCAGRWHLTGMEMTTYAKYRILLFSLELTDGKFLRVDDLEDGRGAIEAKAVFDEMRRTADVVDVGEGAGHRLSLVQEIDSFECRGISRECRGIAL